MGLSIKWKYLYDYICNSRILLFAGIVILKSLISLHEGVTFPYILLTAQEVQLFIWLPCQRAKH